MGQMAHITCAHDAWRGHQLGQGSPTAMAWCKYRQAIAYRGVPGTMLQAHVISCSRASVLARAGAAHCTRIVALGAAPPLLAQAHGALSIPAASDTLARVAAAVGARIEAKLAHGRAGRPGRVWAIACGRGGGRGARVGERAASARTGSGAVISARRVRHSEQAAECLAPGSCQHAWLCATSASARARARGGRIGALLCLALAPLAPFIPTCGAKVRDWAACPG